MTDTATSIELGPVERWVKARIGKGTARFVITSTIPVCVSSMAITSLAIEAFDAWQDREIWAPSLFFSVLTPALIAPPIFLYFARLVQLLDRATAELLLAAETDPLTGAKNRRGFFAAVDVFEFNDGAITMIMVDLDDFKMLNDRYGHDLGDRALTLVAQWLQDVAGDRGTVGRLGGDEFACVSDTTLADVPTRQVFTLGDVTFTVSVGHATSKVSAADALINADAELYRQKQARHDHGEHHAA